MTENGEWGIFRDKKGRIKGVYSTNKGKPLKSGGFPSTYRHFENAEVYADWKFVYATQSAEEGSR